jgi:hypothetical protein
MSDETDLASMDMAALLEEMLPTPQSPDPEQSSALDEVPDLHESRRVLKKRFKRKLEPELSEPSKFARPPSKDGDGDEDPEPPMPHLLLSPGRVVEREFENLGVVGWDKGQGPADEAGSSAIVVPAFPCPTLRLQMRPSKKASMSGGSSAHNVQKPVKLERTLSVYVSFSPPAEVDPETLFEQSELPALASPRKTCTLQKQHALAVERTPPRSLVVLTVDREFEVGPAQQLCSFDVVQLFGDLDLSQFTMSD